MPHRYECVNATASGLPDPTDRVGVTGICSRKQHPRIANTCSSIFSRAGKPRRWFFRWQNSRWRCQIKVDRSALVEGG